MFSQMNVKKLLVLFTLAFCFLSVVPLAFAQNEAGGPGASSDKNDSNPGTASDIREDFYKRMKNAKSFAPTKYGGEDVVVEEESKGPGKVKHNLTGPVQVWPVFVKEAVSIVPTMRDQGIQRNPLITFGLPISDTQYQILHRYDQNIMLEQLFDPEKVIWVINAMGMIQTQSAANSAANLARNQSASAIEYAEKYLPNFTTQAGNRWNTIRDKLFVPMAVLLLLPGAVLAQVKAIIAQGSPLFGDVNPFDGIIRSIVAIFFIPATYLVVNYGIDVSNSMALTIRDNYQRIFHSNMYKDAECAEKRAFPIRPKDSNDNGIFRKTQPSGKGAGDLQAWTDHERESYDIYGPDPCKGGSNVNDLADETTPVLMNISRVAVNIANVGLAGTWNVMCAFQLAYLHYLFLMGPIVAALWVWPIDTFRKALGSWIEGVLIICFWALFWNTTILLMACFRNVCTTGTVIMTALNVLAIYSVQHAFNFLGLVAAAGREAASAAQEAGSHAAGNAAALGAKAGVGAQGAAITAAHKEAGGHAAGGPGAPGGQPGAGAPAGAAAGQSAGLTLGGGPLGSGATGHGGAAGGSGGIGAGHGGAGGTSPFGSPAGSQATAGPQGAGAHVAPPPGTAQAGSSQFSGAGPGGVGPAGGTQNMPPAFGGVGTAGGHGAAGQSGSHGAVGQGGASTPGSTGGQGSQQPGITGAQSSSLSNSQSSQSHNAIAQGQAAGLNPPPGSPISAGDTTFGGSNVSANQQLHGGQPDTAQLHQGGINANLGMNVHEGSHTANTFGGANQMDASVSSNIIPGPPEAGFGAGGVQFPTDAAAGQSSGFSSDIAYNPPPVFDPSVSANFSQPPEVVHTTEIQNTQTETQTTQTEIQNMQTEVQNIQTESVQMVPQEISTPVVSEAQPAFMEQQPVFDQSQYARPETQYIAGGVEQSHVTTDSSPQVVQENVTNQTVAENSSTTINNAGAVSQGGLQSNIPPSNPLANAGGTPNIASAMPGAAAGGSSVIDRILKSSAPQSAEFSGPRSSGGFSQDESSLLQSQGMPPGAANTNAGAAPSDNFGNIADSPQNQDDKRINQQNIAKANQEDEETG
ncbi:MAG: hypothetical protein K2Y22_05175 [Candidatus Obscuribacterales bacterium]|nr:hypothetical protein [Candidatus Obscuribacterales bacterium]